jgi:hypothetical protein
MGCRVLAPGFWVLVPGLLASGDWALKIKGSGFKAQEICSLSCTLDTRCWMLVSGYWALAAGFLLLDIRCWTLDTGLWHLTAG